MKVYIGKYSNTWCQCNIFTDYMTKKYQYDWSEPNTSFEKFLEKTENSIQWIYNHSINYLLKHRKRKINVRIDRYDTWGMDHTLAYIILPMLKQLKDTKHGSPYVEQQDLPEHLRFTEREERIFSNEELNAMKEERKAVEDKFHSQWNWILEQMIWSFEQELDQDNDYKNYYDPHESDEIIDDIFSLGKFNPEKYKAYNERKQLGFTLFGKYYQSLWD